MRTPADEIERRAILHPVEPFLIFRDPRGHFAWWSWARCRELAAQPLSDAPPTQGEPAALLAEVLAAPEAVIEQARALLAVPRSPPPRPIWISRRPLAVGAERALAVAALLGGWALLREPSDASDAARLFAWARPTLVSGPLGELERWLDAMESEAPRWRAGSWLRRRLRRLDVVWLEGDDAGAGALRERLCALAPGARLLSFPPGGW